MSEPTEPTPKLDRANFATGWRLFGVWVLSVIVRTWVRTLRFHWVRPEERELARRRESPVVMLMWHNRGFSAPWLARTICRVRPTYAMVSVSRDGATMGSFFRILGLKLVHGSSSRFGREALHEMIACVRAGNDIAFTPDGPRGPLYEIKGGAIIAARRGNAGLLLVGVDFKSAWRLRSWDRYFIPKPFSRVAVRLDLIPADQVPRGEEGLAGIRQRLLELSGSIDDVPPRPVAAPDKPEGAATGRKTPSPG